MRTKLFLLAVTVVASIVACGGQDPNVQATIDAAVSATATARPTPTPNIQATVDAAISATATATSPTATPTPAPTATPTPVPIRFDEAALRALLTKADVDKEYGSLNVGDGGYTNFAEAAPAEMMGNVVSFTGLTFQSGMGEQVFLQVRDFVSAAAASADFGDPGTGEFANPDPPIGDRSYTTKEGEAGAVGFLSGSSVFVVGAVNVPFYTDADFGALINLARLVESRL